MGIRVNQPTEDESLDKDIETEKTLNRKLGVYVANYSKACKGASSAEYMEDSGTYIITIITVFNAQVVSVPHSLYKGMFAEFVFAAPHGPSFQRLVDLFESDRYMYM